MNIHFDTIKSDLLQNPAFNRVEIRNALCLSTGFWSVYLISHWTGAQIGALPLGPFNFYGFVMLVLVALGLLNLFCRPFLQKHELVIDRACSIGMVTAIPLTFYTPSLLGESVLTTISLVVNAICSTWFLVRWGSEYTRVALERAFLSLVMGAVIVSCLKMGMAVISKAAMMVLMLPVPVVSYFSLCRVNLDRQRINTGVFGWHEGGHQPNKVGGSFWIMGMAILIFLLIWSSINMVSKLGSGHYGYGPSSAPLLVLFAQVIDIVTVMGLCWWFFMHGGSIDFGQLWRIAFMALAIALTIVWYLGVVPLVQGFTSAAIELALFLLWLLITAYSHHTDMEPSAVVSFGHLLHIVPQWFVRTIGALFGTAGFSGNVEPIFFLLIVIAVTVMLPHRSPDAQLMLSGLNSGSMRSREDCDVAARCIEIARTYGLTDRETEIIRHLCYGRTKQYIAETMSLSENTIRTYARRAYLKLNIHTRQELQDLVWGKDV